MTKNSPFALAEADNRTRIGVTTVRTAHKNNIKSKVLPLICWTDDELMFPPRIYVVGNIQCCWGAPTRPFN